MISRIEGRVVRVGDGRVEIRCGALTYSLLIPATDEARVAGCVGEDVEFHALHYLEAQGQGSSFVPRLIGFESVEARAFFEMLTTVKGLGSKKALRALAMPFAAIAEAISNKDVDLLTTLPEIGRRTAETIVAELHGKVERFVELKPGIGGGPIEGLPGMVQDAMAAMTQVGEPRAKARRLIERALADNPALESADELVAAAYRVGQSD